MNAINMEPTSDIVYDGKLIHEFSYNERSEKYSEITVSHELENGITLIGKIDFYNRSLNLVHETKRSDKLELAHEWQVKYYLWLLTLNGVPNPTGLLEYPKLRKTMDIELSEADVPSLHRMVDSIVVLYQQRCPPTINSGICKNCSYFDLCYIDEV
ncbi:CRISPR-associated exonuclease Cas4 [Chitinophaga terrae (ex Kim and Jung 2007)]|uniref:CRISPR-associated exonuclease Cas4 n=2 Tax=Chitinophaga terrae (ex Kim and Jung 2007) TaxID=408074 RepID=A0A1H4F131_9BACT|nr:CRISPR-associated protein Cas4 [Chitinophaga terrae (ex Kim and Jung 2007)]SEA90568.1 CRISPR-associated exonuclease Cas4 [Chitinophaga terrae (ex Kim and Jung 2007)]